MTPTPQEWLALQTLVKQLTERVEHLEKQLQNINQRTRSMVRVGGPYA